MVNMRGIVRTAVPLMVVGLLAVASVIPVAATTMPRPAAATSCDREPGRPSDKPVPPGQMKRRGVVGDIVAVDAETGTILIEMKFGTVEMTVPEDVELTEDMIGSRVAGLMEKEVSAEESAAAEEGVDSTTREGADGTEGGATEDGESTEEPLQSGNLVKLKSVHNDSTRTHEPAVLTTQEDGTVEVLDENGEVETLEVEGEGEVQVVVPEEGEPTTVDGEAGTEGSTGTDESASTSTGDATGGDAATGSDTGGEQLTTVTEDIEDGTDVVLLVQCTDADAEPKVRGMQKADRVTERLERLEAKLAEKDEERAEKVAERIQEKEQRREERLEKTAANAPQGQKDKADRALGKAKGEIEESDRGKPDDTGKDGDKGSDGDKGNDNDKGSDGDKRKDPPPEDPVEDEGDSDPPADEGGGGGKGKDR